MMAAADAKRTDREYTAVRCDNCGTFITSGGSVYEEEEGEDTSINENIVMCAPCASDFRPQWLRPGGMNVREWIARNNPPSEAPKEECDAYT